MSKHKLNYPSALSMEKVMNRGLEYAEAKSEEYEEFNKYANFKMKTTNMSKDKKKRKNEKLDIDELNKENFTWRTGDGEYSLEEMDLDSCLVAISHFLGKADENYNKNIKHSKAVKVTDRNIDYFITLVEIAKSYVYEEYGVELPSKKHEVQTMRDLIKKDIFKVSADTRAKQEINSDE